MKLLIALGITSLAAFSAQDTKHTGDHASCCGALNEIKASYLEVANPPAPDVGKGDVKGKVTFDGKREKIKPLTIKEEAAKDCTEEGSQVSSVDRSLVIDKEGGLANVVVSIEVKGAKVKVPEKPISMDQIACRYEPHVSLVPVGSTIRFLNSDKVTHNVHAYPGRNDPMNDTVAPGSKRDYKVPKPDKIEIKCDIHPWMNAHIFVTDQPYTAVSKADGTFTVEGVPAGEYEVEMWHEKLGRGKATGKLTVKEDGTSELLELKLGKSKKRRPRRGM